MHNVPAGTPTVLSSVNNVSTSRLFLHLAGIGSCRLFVHHGVRRVIAISGYANNCQKKLVSQQILMPVGGVIVRGLGQRYLHGSNCQSRKNVISMEAIVRVGTTLSPRKQLSESEQRYLHGSN